MTALPLSSCLSALMLATAPGAGSPAPATPAPPVPAAAVPPRAAPPSALAPPPGRVPLSEGFSLLGTSLGLAAAATGVVLFIGGDSLIDTPAPSMGPPAEGSLDSRLSRYLYRRGSRRLWVGLPDLAGAYLLPIIPAVWYGADTAALELHGRAWSRADANPHHRLFAYIEAAGWTYLVTGFVKYTVGRPRPYTEGSNNHPELRHKASQDNLSFFSGHASVSFAVGAFMAEDVSRYLRRVPLAGSSRLRRFLLGTLLPYTVGYGVPAIIGVSRIVDQQHWPTDVAVGAAAGALIANAVYALHFDSEGNPERRRVHTGGGDARARGPRLALVPSLAPPIAGGRGHSSAPLGLTCAYLGRF
jgi:membrane-associated phospholipid phosphatase